MDAWSARQGLR